MSSASPFQGRLEADGTFVLEDYNRATAFSSFLPGIAGLWGTPLWVYTVNRGQGVACFGTEDKDHAILEFSSAARHWRRAALEGFRTFLRLGTGPDAPVHEPFRMPTAGAPVRQTMRITPADLTVEEVHEGLGLAVTVTTFTVPNEPWAALARRVRVENRTDAPLELEVADGLPMVVPYGEGMEFLKIMPFITEGYLQVRDLDRDAPYLNLKAIPSDTAETEFVEAGNVFLGVREAGGPRGLLRAIVDPGLVFGPMTDFHRPYAFEAPDFDPDAPQTVHCITPCGFVTGRFRVKPGEAAAWSSLYGRARSLAEAHTWPAKLAEAGWLDAKAEANRLEVEKVRHRLFLHSGSDALNEYGPQTLLDNCLRGGLPIELPAKGRRVTFHVYSRKHGDLERDYNFFRLEPTRLSQGNGHFRDVNQNRRNDPWICPAVGAENLRFFLNLLQPDGFNPLVCLGVRFHVPPGPERDAALTEAVAEADRARLAAFLDAPFTPGELLEFVTDEGIGLADGPEALLEALLALAEKREEAEHGVGYWTDHWFYNVDLLESFLAIFPDRLREVLVEDATYTFRDTHVRVLPRDRRFVLVAPGKVRQPAQPAHDAAKAARIAARPSDPHRVRTRHGEGEVYRTTLLGKIVALLAVKLASVSPSGVGLEMDGGRPGWHDSINGLPGLIGATTSEVFQLLRAVRLVSRWLDELALPDDHVQPVPVEVRTLLDRLAGLLERFAATEDDPDRDLVCWQSASDAKEAYRDAVWPGFDGAEADLAMGELREWLGLAEVRLEASLAASADPETGLPLTYVAHEATEFEPIETPGPDGRPVVQRDPRGRPYVRVRRFELKPLPLFLEAPMHALRTESDPERAQALREKVRATPLYDGPLGMYIVNAPVPESWTEIGRIWAWPPGWFERENVFMHLEHKFLLAELAAGLPEAFYEDMRRCWVPFQPPERFGRSTLENVSCIVATTHPRAAFHGRGLLPRTSGMTAEVVHTLLWMSFGQRPFRIEDDRVVLRLEPVLPDWLFTEAETARERVAWDGTRIEHTFPAGSYAALFLGRTLVTYVNPDRRPTFGPEAARVQRYTLTYGDGRTEAVEGAALPEPQALAVRDGRVTRLEVALA